MRPMVIFLTLSLAACGSRAVSWEKADFSPEQYQRDHYECLKDGYTTGDAYVTRYGWVWRDVNTDMVHACMKARGYTARRG